MQLALEDGEGSNAGSAEFTDAPGAATSAGSIGTAPGITSGVAATAAALSFLIDPVDMAL